MNLHIVMDAEEDYTYKVIVIVVIADSMNI